MTKKSGFKIRIDAFVEIDRKDYGKQAAAYAMMADITSTNKLPDDFFAKATIISTNFHATSKRAVRVMPGGFCLSATP